MKITLKVLGTIFALVALLVSAGATYRNFRDAADTELIAADVAKGKAELEQLKNSMAELGGDSSEMNSSLSELDSMVNDLPSKGQFTAAGVASVILGILSIFLIVFQYVNKRKPAAIMLVLTLVVAIASIALAPVVAETLTGGASNRTLAIIAAVPAILAALTAFAVSRMNKSTVTVA